MLSLPPPQPLLSDTHNSQTLRGQQQGGMEPGIYGAGGRVWQAPPAPARGMRLLYAPAGHTPRWVDRVVQAKGDHHLLQVPPPRPPPDPPCRGVIVVVEVGGECPGAPRGGRPHHV